MTSDAGITVRASTAPGAGAIAIVEVHAPEGEALEAFLRSVGIDPPTVGRFGVRDLAGIDSGVVARPGENDAMLMAHGAAFVVERLLELLRAGGATTLQSPQTLPVREKYPEAEDLIEACKLDALANAASPLAIDVIVHHADRWRRATDDERARATDHLRALMDPPIVALLGGANVGKSTLTNAMAGRSVSIVADEPGTTRDHVGVLMECDGLTIHWLDTPGLAGTQGGTGSIEDRAEAMARRVVGGADLVVLCADAAGPGFEEVLARWGGAIGGRVIRCGLRADLGTVPHGEVMTSGATGAGLGELAKAIRGSLASDEPMFSGGLWRFHPQLPPGSFPGTPGTPAYS